MSQSHRPTAPRPHGRKPRYTTTSKPRYITTITTTITTTINHHNQTTIHHHNHDHNHDHNQTALGYGSSEIQFSDALASLIASGEVKREDIIIQVFKRHRRQLRPSPTLSDPLRPTPVHPSQTLPPSPHLTPPHPNRTITRPRSRRKSPATSRRRWRSPSARCRSMARSATSTCSRSTALTSR